MATLFRKLGVLCHTDDRLRPAYFHCAGLRTVVRVNSGSLRKYFYYSAPLNCSRGVVTYREASLLSFDIYTDQKRFSSGGVHGTLQVGPQGGTAPLPLRRFHPSFSDSRRWDMGQIILTPSSLAVGLAINRAPWWRHHV